MQDRLTVLVTTYVRPDLARVAVETSQHFTPFPTRFILVNNGAPIEAVEAAMEGLSHLEIIHNSENLGISTSIQQGLSHCNTEYFAAVSDDVMFVPSGTPFWEEMISILEDPSVGLVGPLSDGVLNMQRAASICDTPYLQASYLHGLLLLGRTEVWREVGGLEIEGALEVELALEMMKRGYKLVINRRVFVHHDTSATLRTFTQEEKAARHEKAERELIAAFTEDELYRSWTMPGFPSIPVEIPPQDLDRPFHVFTSYRREDKEDGNT